MQDDFDYSGTGPPCPRCGHGTYDVLDTTPGGLWYCQCPRCKYKVAVLT